MKTLDCKGIEHWAYLALLPLWTGLDVGFYLPSVTRDHLKELVSRAEYPVAESIFL